MGDDPKNTATGDPGEKTFTQADVDRIVTGRVAKLERENDRLKNAGDDDGGRLQAERDKYHDMQDKYNDTKAEFDKLKRENAKAEKALADVTAQAETWKQKYTGTLAKAELSEKLAKAGVVPGAVDLAMSHILSEVSAEVGDDGKLIIKQSDGKPVDDGYFKAFFENRTDIIGASATGGAGSTGSPARVMPTTGLSLEQAQAAVKSGAFNTMKPEDQQKVLDTMESARKQ